VGEKAIIEQKDTIFVSSINRGAPIERAEIIPKLPDPDNAGGGKEKCSHSGDALYGIYLI